MTFVKFSRLPHLLSASILALAIMGPGCALFQRVAAKDATPDFAGSCQKERDEEHTKVSSLLEERKATDDANIEALKAVTAKAWELSSRIAGDMQSSHSDCNRSGVETEELKTRRKSEYEELLKVRTATEMLIVENELENGGVDDALPRFRRSFSIKTLGSEEKIEELAERIASKEDERLLAAFQENKAYGQYQGKPLCIASAKPLALKGKPKAPTLHYGKGVQGVEVLCALPQQGKMYPADGVFRIDISPLGEEGLDGVTAGTPETIGKGQYLSTTFSAGNGANYRRYYVIQAWLDRPPEFKDEKLSSGYLLWHP